MRCTERVLSRIWSTSRLKTNADGLFKRLAAHPPNHTALRDSSGVETYGELTNSFASVGATLKSLHLSSSHDTPARVGILKSPGRGWVHSLLGCWHARCVAVPLSTKYPVPSLKPLLDDAGIDVVLTDNQFSDVVRETGRQVVMPKYHTDCDLVGEDVDLNDVRMLLYTSGTTGRPKGVVWNERMLRHHMSVLTDVWKWSSFDKTLCTLPLHHVHGIVNVILCALYAGASIDIHRRFDAVAVWNALLDNDEDAPNVFMGVPTMYRKLIAHYDMADEIIQKRMSDAAQRARLFVAGSAALPARDAMAWARISGVPALERYGMTETGMTLSNSYDNRCFGALGTPLLGVQVRLGEDGELFVRGDGVFDRYWRRDDIIVKDNSNWFNTGDVVRWDDRLNSFIMLGRANSDIINTGGYMVSALEIEECIRNVEGVLDAAVVGVDCDVLGERIVAAIIAADDVRERVLNRLTAVLPLYKVPREVRVVDQFPRNEMGKVQKKILSKMWHNFKCDVMVDDDVGRA